MTTFLTFSTDRTSTLACTFDLTSECKVINQTNKYDVQVTENISGRR